MFEGTSLLWYALSQVHSLSSKHVIRSGAAACYLHHASLCQLAVVLGIHVRYAQGQAIDAKLQVANPQRTAHLALHILLKVHASIGR